MVTSYVVRVHFVKTYLCTMYMVYTKVEKNKKAKQACAYISMNSILASQRI